MRNTNKAQQKHLIGELKKLQKNALDVMKDESPAASEGLQTMLQDIIDRAQKTLKPTPPQKPSSPKSNKSTPSDFDPYAPTLHA